MEGTRGHGPSALSPFSSSRWHGPTTLSPFSLSTLLLVFCITAVSTDESTMSLRKHADMLSEDLKNTFRELTGADKVVSEYDKYFKVQSRNPYQSLLESKETITAYLNLRRDYAFQSKLNLEAKPIENHGDDANNVSSHNFVRYMSVKRGNNGAKVYNGTVATLDVAFSSQLKLIDNANFYHLSTSDHSAVHIPTPIYDRDPEVLKWIEWSDVEKEYRNNKAATRDLGFQLFCSFKGFMRFYPATSWYWDTDDDPPMDLFDCRNTEWYINGATCSKNIIILLDLSGSMLGQRFEIAKQTVETVLDTLSHNDYFQIVGISSSYYILNGCNGTKHEDFLMRASMKNKKFVRDMLDKVNASMKADFEKGLEKAFSLLLGLPHPIEWMTYEQHSLHPRNDTHKEVEMFLHEHVLIVSHDYYDILTNKKQSPYAVPQRCDSAILLITDGAPDSYEEVFHKFNEGAKIRFFSFLLGEEATDFENVKKMACGNRGFMVHIANAADVEEKVQLYVNVMARSIFDQAVNREEAVWSGVYRDRLLFPRDEIFAAGSSIALKDRVKNMGPAKKRQYLKRSEARSTMMVTTVSFPVVNRTSNNNTFLGVSAVNIPLTEISQLAADFRIGARSYYFMLDRNGFVVFHPQLRPIYTSPSADRKYNKPFYNSMEFVELEIPQAKSAESMKAVQSDLLNCRSLTNPHKMDILFASESLDRLYPQSNTYYTACIGDNDDFILGLAVAEGEDNEMYEPITDHFDYSTVNGDWLDEQGGTWRLHPTWRYCLLNDTNGSTMRETAFYTYVRQMMHIKKIPPLCEARRVLVDRFMFDVQASYFLVDQWSKKDKTSAYDKQMVNLVFFTTPTGLMRFHNKTLPNFLYKKADDSISAMREHIDSLESVHFIADKNRKAVDDPYYRRAIRNEGIIVFDVNYLSRMWYQQETVTAFGVPENLTMLFAATQAITKNINTNGTTILGVMGYEMVYDNIVKIIEKNGCHISGKEEWCVLLDEHGYVFYSSLRGETRYTEFYQKDNTQHLGAWFGRLNILAETVIETLVKQSFYKEYQYTDYQAMCSKGGDPETKAAAGSQSIIRSLLRPIVHFFLRTLKSLQLHWLHSLFFAVLQPIDAFTVSFYEMSIGDMYPCVKNSSYLFADRSGHEDKLFSGMVVSSGICESKVEAIFVKGTNLIMIKMRTAASETASCFTKGTSTASNITRFGLQERKDLTEYLFNPNVTQYSEEECRVHAEAERPQKVNSTRRCYNITINVTGLPCSMGSTAPLFAALLLLLLRVS